MSLSPWLSCLNRYWQKNKQGNMFGTFCSTLKISHCHKYNATLDGQHCKHFYVISYCLAFGSIECTGTSSSVLQIEVFVHSHVDTLGISFHFCDLSGFRQSSNHKEEWEVAKSSNSHVQVILTHYSTTWYDRLTTSTLHGCKMDNYCLFHYSGPKSFS